MSGGFSQRAGKPELIFPTGWAGKRKINFPTHQEKKKTIIKKVRLLCASN